MFYPPISLGKLGIRQTAGWPKNCLINDLRKLLS